jgi:hypothetical protein
MDGDSLQGLSGRLGGVERVGHDIILSVVSTRLDRLTHFRAFYDRTR